MSGHILSYGKVCGIIVCQKYCGVDAVIPRNAYTFPVIHEVVTYVHTQIIKYGLHDTVENVVLYHVICYSFLCPA